MAVLGAVSSVVGILAWLGFNPFGSAPVGITGKEFYIQDKMGMTSFSEVKPDAYMTRIISEAGMDPQSPIFLSQQMWEWGANHRGELILQGVNYIPSDDFSVALTIKYDHKTLKLVVECFTGPAFTGQPAARITALEAISVSAPGEHERLVGKIAKLGVGAFEFTADDPLAALSLVHVGMPYLTIGLSTDRTEVSSIFAVRDERDRQLIADATTAMAVQARDRSP